MFAGLPDEEGKTPQSRDGKVRGVYPWGETWPLVEKVGNLADESAARRLGRNAVIKGYNDGFDITSPVGSFPPNKFGLCDLAGNVWEWVSSPYAGREEDRYSGVLRGGCWTSASESNLLTSRRNVTRPSRRGNVYGFRLVLAKTAPSAE